MSPTREIRTPLTNPEYFLRAGAWPRAAGARFAGVENIRIATSWLRRLLVCEAEQGYAPRDSPVPLIVRSTG